MSEFVSDELIEEISQVHIEEEDDDDLYKDAVSEQIENLNVTVKSIETATLAKEEGNAFFRDKDYDEAIDCYSKAIEFCPLDDEHKSTLATFYGNRSAAYNSVEEYDMVVEDCSAALELNSTFVKVLARRMQAFEKLDKLEDALADAKKLKEIESTYPKIDSIISRLQKQSDERMAKMKDEALGKLKELGNTILGNFGMSLDNFKMAQDPGTGSWNISMNK